MFPGGEVIAKAATLIARDLEIQLVQIGHAGLGHHVPSGAAKAQCSVLERDYVVRVIDRKVDVVNHQNHGAALLVAEATQCAHDLYGMPHVEVVEWLVKQQHICLLRNRHCEKCHLPLTATDLIDESVTQRLQRQKGDCLIHGLAVVNSQRATATFIVMFTALIAYGIYVKAATPFVITVMLGLSFVVGMVGGMKFDGVCKSIVKGMAGNVGLYLLFILLELFINYVELAGGFKALTYMLMPMINIGGKVAVIIAGGAIGAFGISGAVVAELVTLNKMFASLLKEYNVSMIAWAVALIVATRVTNFIIPGSNMVAMMGFAQSNNLKAMMRNGYVVALAQTGLLIIYAFVFR